MPITYTGKQLKINFEQPINKPWWMGIACKPMHYFDLLKQNLNINDLMIPWTIEDYQKTKIKEQ